MRRRHSRVSECGISLEFLDHRLIFLRGLHGAHTDLAHSNSVSIVPAVGEDLAERVRKLHRMTRKRTVADSHPGNLREGRLQSCQKLAAELGIDLISRVIFLDISTDVLIEEDRIHHSVRIFAVAADRDVHVEADILVHNTERDCVRCAVLVSDDLLRVEEVDSLVPRRVAAHGETLSKLLKAVPDALSKVSVENTRLCGGIINELTGLRTYLDDSALVNDHHALSLVDCDDGAVGD